MDKQMTLWEHLEELRRVLVISALAMAVTTGIAYGFFRQQLLDLVTGPLKGLGVKLVYIGLGEAFMTQIKLSLLAGFILALPVILWELWSFAAPALRPGEKRMVLLIVFSSLILFGLGASFAYLTVFKFAARFLLVIGGPELAPMLSIGNYVSFLIAFLVPFGLAFEMPLAIYFLARWGVVSSDWLQRHNKVAVVAIFVISAAITPGGDPISQLCMAAPLLILYEVSIVVARLARPRSDNLVSTAKP